MPGPLPNPNARRTSRGAFSFIDLPAHGRVGPPPPYPLSERDDGLAARRAEVWAQLWALPAAVLWEQMRWPWPVARYVELSLAWEGQPGGAGVVLTELRRLEEQLAITRTGALRARVRIEDDPVPASGVGAGGSVLLDLSAWRATHGQGVDDQGRDDGEPERGAAPRGPGC